MNENLSTQRKTPRTILVSHYSAQNYISSTTTFWSLAPLQNTTSSKLDYLNINDSNQNSR